MLVRLASPVVDDTPTGIELVRKRSSVPSGSRVNTAAVRTRAAELDRRVGSGMRIEPGKSPAETMSGGSSGDFCVAASTFRIRTSSESSQAGKLAWLSSVSRRRLHEHELRVELGHSRGLGGQTHGLAVGYRTLSLDEHLLFVDESLLVFDLSLLLLDRQRRGSRAVGFAVFLDWRERPRSGRP